MLVESNRGFSFRYFLFYRAEVRTLRENFLRDIVQMSPSLYTLDAAEDLYGARIDEVYGNIDSPRELLCTCRAPALSAARRRTLLPRTTWRSCGAE